MACFKVSWTAWCCLLPEVHITKIWGCHRAATFVLWSEYTEVELKAINCSSSKSGWMPMHNKLINHFFVFFIFSTLQLYNIKELEKVQGVWILLANQCNLYICKYQLLSYISHNNNVLSINFHKLVSLRFTIIYISFHTL